MMGPSMTDIVQAGFQVSDVASNCSSILVCLESFCSTMFLAMFDRECRIQTGIEFIILAN